MYPALVQASTSPVALPSADGDVRFVSGSPDPTLSCVVLSQLNGPRHRNAGHTRCVVTPFLALPESLDAHDERMNRRRARAQWTWLRHAESARGRG